MNKLLNYSLKKFRLYAGLVLLISIPVYYLALSRLWQYELDEHHIILTPEASREDTIIFITLATLLTTLFFALLLGGFILVNRKISRRLWLPFYKSLSIIRNFDLDQHTSIVFDKTDITEFAELNESLDKLLVGNIAAYHQQKEFADNASHELQTPLAIVQSKLEILLQSQSLAQEQYTTIEQALNALSRVSRINKNLLLLTKIGNSEYMDSEEIELSELLDLLLSLFSVFIETKSIKLTTRIEEKIYVEGNRVLVELLVQNLLNNAIRHSPREGVISITLQNKMLIIENRGTAALDNQKLFKRFATASLQTPGAGLGLSLVKQICTRYNWNISYSFENTLHVFSLRF